MSRIRIKTYLTILPIVASTAVVGSLLSFFEARSEITLAANRHLAYKAEQLRDYINNEWRVVEGLQLSEDPVYRTAQQESFRSYAYSVLRTNTESVMVFDEEGTLVFRIGGNDLFGAMGIEPRAPLNSPLSTGWFSRNLFGEERMGIAFEFPPFRWTVAITELRSRYFSEVEKMLQRQIWVLISAIAVAWLLSAVYLGYILNPLERLTGVMERITETGDLSIRSREETDDEIGILGTRFNGLLDTIEAQEKNLYEANLAEQEAHETTRRREMETLMLLGRISDYKDEVTGAHLVRIGTFTGLFARLLGLGEEEAQLLTASAPLHDIGKIAIPESVLQKPGKLTPEEYGIIKTHTDLGYELLRSCESQFLSVGADIARTHHERWDGGGYPRGLHGEEIPLAGRIVSVIDVFDALISERPYKEAWSRERALEHIIEQKEKHFDPDLVDIFRENFDLFKLEETKGEPALSR